MDKVLENLSVNQELDEKLMSVVKYLTKVEYYLQPTNVASEKDKFLSGKKKNPEFEYHPIDFDPKKVSQFLKELVFPDDIIGNLLKAQRDDFLLKCDIILFRGNSEKLIELSSKLNGRPSEKILALSHKIISEERIIKDKSVKDISSGGIASLFEDALRDYGLEDSGWGVQFTEKSIIEVNSNLKKIFVPRGRFFSSEEVESLIAHEIGVHVLRAENGYKQKLKIFSVGLPGYLSTEEGLALFAQDSFLEEAKKNFKKAVIVLAVDTMINGASFRECFESLKKFNLSDEELWNICLRIYRGGGYVKDHVYLEGFMEVENFLKNGGNLKKLFVGKVGIKDLEIVDKLLKEGILKEPTILPDFVK